MTAPSLVFCVGRADPLGGFIQGVGECYPAAQLSKAGIKQVRKATKLIREAIGCCSPVLLHSRDPHAQLTAVRIGEGLDPRVEARHWDRLDAVKLSVDDVRVLQADDSVSGNAVILVSHNGVLRSICDRVSDLRAGEVVQLRL